MDEGQPFIAGVRYEDGTCEMVPTMVVAERYPHLVRAFYESRIRFAGNQVSFEELIALNEAKLAQERDQTMTSGKSVEEN